MLTITTTSHGQALPAALASERPRFAPAEVIVQFKSDVSDAQISAAFQRAGLGFLSHLRTPSMEDNGLIGLTRAATAMPVETAVRILNQLPGIDFAEPNWTVLPQSVPNDPLYLDGSLWGLGLASPSNPSGCAAETAWAMGYIGSPDIYVGVVDGGLELDHPDLMANIWTNPGEIPANGIDDDGDGFVDDVHGWNAANNNGMVSYEDPINDTHGTHVAGTIGALGGNGLGVVGVNWNVKLISGKIFGTNNGTSFGSVQALDYMTTLKTRKGLNIVALNHSWYVGGFSQALLDAFSRAAQAGILSSVAAANFTNNSDVAVTYPSCFNTTPYAGYDAVISVAALTRDGNLATYSNYGLTNVDLAAPGGDRPDLSNPDLHDPAAEIVSTLPIQTYGPKRGTSMAAPHVTGALALYASVHPGSSPPQIRHRLLVAGVRPLPALQGKTVTGGALDVGALMSDSPNQLTPPNAPAGLQAVLGAGGRVDLSWTDQSSNELGFAIERSTDGQNYFLVDTVGANLRTCSDWKISANASFYFYRVRAYNPGGNSGYATAALATANVALPIAPVNLVASALTPAKGGGVALTWTDKANNEAGFMVERKTLPTGDWRSVVTLGANTTKYTDTSTVSRTQYTYHVRSYNIAGNSAASNEVIVTAK